MSKAMDEFIVNPNAYEKDERNWNIRRMLRFRGQKNINISETNCRENPAVRRYFLFKREAKPVKKSTNTTKSSELIFMKKPVYAFEAPRDAR